MLEIKERVAATIQNPPTDTKILFNDAADGKIKTKDSSGVLEELSTDLVGVPTGGATGEVLAKASATDGDVEWVDPTGGVKEYVALLTQTGTDAPVATILKNTLGGVPVWSYVDVGEYNCTLVGIFDLQKTFTTITNNVDETKIHNRILKIDEDTIKVRTGEYLFTAPDTLDFNPINVFLSETSIKIEVYP